MRLVYRMEDDNIICEHCKGENGNEFSSGELTADQIIQHMQVAAIFNLNYKEHTLTRELRFFIFHSNNDTWDFVFFLEISFRVFGKSETTISSSTEET